LTERFVSVNDNVLLEPTATVPKSRLVGENSARVPVPYRVRFCGLVGALSLIVTVPT